MSCQFELDPRRSRCRIGRSLACLKQSEDCLGTEGCPPRKCSCILHKRLSTAGCEEEAVSAVELLLQIRIETKRLAWIAILELNLALEAAINSIGADQLKARVALTAPRIGSLDEEGVAADAASRSITETAVRTSGIAETSDQCPCRNAPRTTP